MGWCEVVSGEAQRYSLLQREGKHHRPTLVYNGQPSSRPGETLQIGWGSRVLENPISSRWRNSTRDPPSMDKSFHDPVKRANIFQNLLANGVDIIALQEIHCSNSVLQAWVEKWEGLSEWNCGDWKSLGTAFLFRPKLNVHIMDGQMYFNGRVLALTLEIDECQLQILNTYAPNPETKVEIEEWFVATSIWSKILLRTDNRVLHDIYILMGYPHSKNSKLSINWSILETTPSQN